MIDFVIMKKPTTRGDECIDHISSGDRHGCCLVGIGMGRSGSRTGDDLHVAHYSNLVADRVGLSAAQQARGHHVLHPHLWRSDRPHLDRLSSGAAGDGSDDPGQVLVCALRHEETILAARVGAVVSPQDASVVRRHVVRPAAGELVSSNFIQLVYEPKSEENHQNPYLRLICDDSKWLNRTGTPTILSPACFLFRRKS